VHTSELARWDQVYAAGATDTEPARALGDLIVASVRAAVVAPEREVRRWYSWGGADTITGDLVRDGRLRRVNGMITATR
jgi:hypothetical protein